MYAGVDRFVVSVGCVVVGVVPATFAALGLIGEDVWTGMPAIFAVRVSSSEVRPVFYDVGDERRKEREVLCSRPRLRKCRPKGRGSTRNAGAVIWQKSYFGSLLCLFA